MSDKSGMHCANAKLMPAGHIAALLIALLMAGCAGLDKAPTSNLGRIESTQGTTVAPILVAAPTAVPVTSTNAMPSIDAISVAAVSLDPTTTPSSESRLLGQTAAKATAPTAATSAKAVASPVPAVQVAKKDSAPSPPARSAAAPSLDMKSLEARLKDTQAIGVFTKLALKNQVNDLLDQFRAYYRGQLKTTLADLRRPYEMLLQKVLALLQDGDPPLAGAIVASREAIWGILADPAKFATI